MQIKAGYLPTHDWPEPVEVLNEDGPSDIVLLCEHASNHIPDEYAGLGLGSEDLTRHIAWDIGAAEVTRRLSAILRAPAFLAPYSRLLIDLNRPLDAPSSIVTRSEDTDIPGNHSLSPAEGLRRAQRIFLPFHDRVTQHLNQRQTDARATRLVTIHSFTPVYQGISRPWHAGILFDRAEALGHALIERLNSPDRLVGPNVPYISSRDEDYAIPIHGDDRGIPAVLVEIRNDLIAGEPGQIEWAARLAEAINALTPRSGNLARG